MGDFEATVIRKLDSLHDAVNWGDEKLRQVAQRLHPAGHIKFVWFLTVNGDEIMASSVIAPNITASLAFVLNGQTPEGATFTEPTVAVTTGSGSVVLQPSVQGTGGAFTTAGVFTPAAGFTGAVVLSAEVQGVDDEDCSFSVVPAAPETVAFDPSKFVAT